MSYHGERHAVNLVFVFGLVLSEGTVPEQENRERKMYTDTEWRLLGKERVRRGEALGRENKTGGVKNKQTQNKSDTRCQSHPFELLMFLHFLVKTEAHYKYYNTLN